LRLLRKCALSRPRLDLLGKKLMALVLWLWLLGTAVVVLALTVLGGVVGRNVEEKRGPEPDWDKSRALFHDWDKSRAQREEERGEGIPGPGVQRHESGGIAEPALPLQEQQAEEIAPALQGGKRLRCRGGSACVAGGTSRGRRR
jgi:hypothetical protein